MRPGLFQLLCTVVAALLAAGWAAPVLAQVGTVGAPIAVCVKRVAAGDDAVALLARPTGFDCATPQHAFGPGDYWVISAPLQVGVRRHAGVRIASLWQRSATLWARYADGAVAMLPGDGRAISRRLQLGAIVEYRLPDRDAAPARLLWRVDGASNVRGIVISPRLATPTESAHSNLVLAALYAGFGGLCLSLLLYNIALFGALRHRFQLAYCAMLAGLLLYALSSSGALAWLWPDLPNNARLRVNYLALAWSGSAALLFARTFFEPRVFAGWLGRAMWGVCGALLAAAILYATLAPWQHRLLDRLYAGSFALLLAITAPILWRAWRQRSNYLWLFAIGWAGPITLAAMRLLGSLGLIGYNFLLDNSTLMAMASEALLSSLAIAYRIRLLSRERDEAREQEVAARLLADSDPLTGLCNRRAFLAQAIGRPGDQRLLIVDIDHFKRVNETIGHDGGDEVLRAVARALRRAVPPHTLLARIGGEEFAIVAAADQPLSADRVLETLRAVRMPFDLAVTASIGSCTGPLARETDWKLLYRQADRALFAAKAAGRDRARDAATLGPTPKAARAA